MKPKPTLADVIAEFTADTIDTGDVICHELRSEPNQALKRVALKHLEDPKVRLLSKVDPLATIYAYLCMGIDYGYRLAKKEEEFHNETKANN